MKKSLHRPSEPENDDAWLITYADMVTLLLCFFVILFAISTPDKKHFEQVAQALRVQGFFNDVIPIEDPYETLKQHVEMSLGASGYADNVAIHQTDEFVSMEIASGAFFEPLSAKFTGDALAMLRLMSDQILPMKNQSIRIEVEGHTDDTPINTEYYPSNWELSAARAANVARYLIAQGFPPEKIRVVGLANTQPKAANTDPAGNPIPANQDLNRRVTLKLLKQAP